MTPGFGDPVLNSQAVFRAVLDAIARPGTIHAIAGAADPPMPLDRATASVLLTLVDAETPLWLDPAAESAAPWLAFHCGAPPAPLDQAAFAVALSPVPLEALHPGTDEVPEDGATLLLQVAALGEGVRYVLDGPGLERASSFAADGLPDGFAAAWARNRGRFPRGIDLILCAGDRIAALPRTLRVTEG